MIAYFGTVIRTAPVTDGGELVRLDWRSKTVEAKTPVWPREPDLSNDPNPRGSSRGCRGISVVDGTVIGATYHTLNVFDAQLNHVRDVSHPLMVGMHEIHRHETNRVWVTCTSIDAALEFDVDTGRLVNEFWPQEMPAIAKYFNLTPLGIDKNMDHRAGFLDATHNHHPSHVHLNAVRVWNGQVMGLLNRFGAIVNFCKQSVVVHDKELNHAHNLEITDDGIAIVNNTFNQSIHLYDMATGERIRVISLRNYPVVRKLTRTAWISNLLNAMRKRRVKSTVARPIFVRGLDQVGDHLFVGISPASILRIDINTGKLVDFYNYSPDVRVCVHGLKVVPSSCENGEREKEH